MSRRFVAGVVLGATLTSIALALAFVATAPPEPAAALGSLATPAVAPGAPPDADCGAVLGEIADLEAERLELERRELRASTEHDRHQIALEDLGEVPLPWPDDVPDVLRPERFEEELWRRVEGLAGVQVEAVDCSEYPCIGIFRVDGGGSDWAAPTYDVTGDLGREAYGEERSVWAMSETTYERGEPVSEPQIGLRAFAVFPNDDHEAVVERLRSRSRLLHADLKDRLAEALEGAAEP